MEIVRQLYLDRLIARKHNGLVKVITGIRRCGKSYLLLNLFKRHLLESGVAPENILIYEFDRWQSRHLRDPEAFFADLEQKINQTGRTYVLLDEVQMLADFSEVLNSLLREPNLDLYVTGSNSKFLSSDVLTEFRGRGDEVHVFPLSFSEFMRAYDGDVYSGWTQYCTFGGMPMTLGMATEEQKAAYLKRLFDETYLKDIVERNSVGKPQELEELIDVMASCTGTLTNPSKIADTFKSRLKSSITVNTVRTYIGYLQEAFLLTVAHRYDVKGRKYIGTPHKYYFEDVGLRNARLQFRQVEETHLMENIIFNELRLRGYGVDVGCVNQRSVQDGRSLGRQLEVDFVANQGSRRIYVQSAYRMADEEKLRQEKASLMAIRDAFKKIIIVGHPIKAAYDEDGIYHMSIFDFLLKSDSLLW